MPGKIDEAVKVSLLIFSAAQESNKVELFRGIHIHSVNNMKNVNILQLVKPNVMLVDSQRVS